MRRDGGSPFFDKTLKQESNDTFVAELKTKKNDASVKEFLASEAGDRLEDCQKLLKIFSETTKEKPTMWGTSIIGFGSYHYKSERSSQEGDWMLTGFSPRKKSISIYIMSGFKKYGELLEKLGKHKVSGGSCLYINKLSDINTTVLKKLIKASVEEMKIRYK